MGRLYIEAWSQCFNKTEKLSRKKKVELLLSQFPVLARFLFIAGLILLLTGIFLNCLAITIIGIVLLSALLIGLTIDTKKSKKDNSLSNIDLVRNCAQTMVPQFLECLKISNSELPMVLKCIKEYYETQVVKERSISEKLFDFSICGLVASCLVLALEFLKNDSSEWSLLALILCILIPLFAFCVIAIQWVVDSLQPTAIDKTELIIRYLECYLIYNSHKDTSSQHKNTSKRSELLS